MKNFIKRVFAGIGTIAGLALVGYLSEFGVRIEKNTEPKSNPKPERRIAFSYNEKDPVQVKMAMLGKSAMESDSSYYIMQYGEKIAKLAMDENATSEAKIVAVNILMFMATELIDSDYYRKQLNDLATMIV